MTGVALAVTACGPTTSSTALGSPHAARQEDCELALVGQADVQPGGKYAIGYEMVGLVSIAADVGAQATDEDVKKKIRPKACALGGELISLAISQAGRNRFGSETAQVLAFSVYAKKTSAAPQKY